MASKRRTTVKRTFDTEGHKSVKPKAAPPAKPRELPEGFNVREAKMEYYKDPFTAPRYKRRMY